MSANVTAAFGRLMWLTTMTSTVFLAPLASAQFGYPGGMLNLPADDFTWSWGTRRASARDREDFSVLGNDSGFRCDLRGKFRAGGMGSFSRLDSRSFENQIRDQVRFITAASNKMNELEAQGALQWATLQCVKPKREE